MTEVSEAQPGHLTVHPAPPPSDEDVAQVLGEHLAAHEDAAVYQVTDYHWLLLWEVLHAHHAAERPVPWPTFDAWVSPDSGYFEGKVLLTP